MQKKLLGMAVAAALAMPAVALAQSAVQVYGTVHLSLNHAKYTKDTVGTLEDATKMGVTSHASNWGLRSTETVGGGMTAWFQVEYNMKMARDNGTFDGDATSRNSGVGLRGNFGNVYFGTWETPWAQTFRLWDVGTIGGWGPVTSIIGRREQTGTNPSRNCINNTGAGGAALSGSSALIAGNNICGNGSESTSGPNGNLGYSLWRRYNYAFFYESPLFEGVQAKVAWQPNERKAQFVTPDATHINENPSSWSGSLTWTGLGGRARAFVATMQNKDWTTVGKTDGGFTMGGGYDFGMVNVGATYEDYTYKVVAGDMKVKEWGVGLAVPLGPGKIGGSYAKAKKNEVAGVTIDGTEAKMWNLGYEWALSKRTALGFGIAKIDNGVNQVFSWTATIPVQNGWQSGAVPAGVDITNIFVSMRHSF